MEGITKGQQRALALLRVAMGYVFFFAGAEKFLDLSGTGKAFSAAGFLKFGTTGTWPGTDAKVVVNPTHDLWVSLAGNAGLMHIVDTMVVFGELAIGIALLLGIATRFASIMGTIMLLLFFVASWNFSTGIVNEQLGFALTTAVLGYLGAGRYYGIDAIIEKLDRVKATPAFRYVLG